MTSKKDRTSFMHPHLQILLETESKIQSPAEKVSIGKLRSGDLVEVFTLNTCYTLQVIDPKKDLVKATSNGKHVRSSRRFRVLGPIVVGHSLFLEATKRNEQKMVETVNTSSVQKIMVNGQQVS